MQIRSFTVLPTLLDANQIIYLTFLRKAEPHLLQAPRLTLTGLHVILPRGLRGSLALLGRL
jgi:hypothetical protein